MFASPTFGSLGTCRRCSGDAILSDTLLEKSVRCCSFLGPVTRCFDFVRVACTHVSHVTHVLASLEALGSFANIVLVLLLVLGNFAPSRLLTCISLSFDRNGILEYWGAQSCGRPPTGAVTFKFKTDTDLYDLAKAKTKPCSICFSHDGRSMATTSRDKQVSCACGSVKCPTFSCSFCRGELP